MSIKKNPAAPITRWYSKISPKIHRYFIFGILIFGILWYAVYTTYIIEQIGRYSKASTRAHAQLASEAFFDKMGKMAKHIVIEDIIEDFDMPIIFTDMNKNPMFWFNISHGSLFRREVIDFHDTSFYARQILRKKIEEFEKKYPPKLVFFKDAETRMGWLYYDDSSFLRGLAWMPFFEGLFIVIVILGVYLFLRAVQSNEKTSLWVGLAKETAHQMGTPITSLMGWIEYLELESNASLEEDFSFMDDNQLSQKVSSITTDMKKDVERLRKVANRFGLIGSLPALEKRSVESLLNDHVEYFSRRLPSLSKKVALELNCTPPIPELYMNSDLLEWVFENLFKNSLDAMDKPTGEISINAYYVEVDKKVVITHRDNGKGISRDNRSMVFSAGYTTKKRGWGLGLTLAKRIIEEYHKGRIYISWTQKGVGTEFTVELPISAIQPKRG